MNNNHHDDPPDGDAGLLSIYRWPFAVFVVLVATGVAYLIDYLKTLL